MTGCYIFVPKDYNTLTEERLIQLSGNNNAVLFIKNEIEFIVQQTAGLVGINLDEFEKNKKEVKEHFREILKQKDTVVKYLKQEGEQEDTDASDADLIN